MARLCKRCCEIAEFASSTEGDVCTNCGKFESDGTEFTAEVERNAAGQQYGTFVSDTGRVAGAGSSCSPPGSSPKQAVPYKAIKEIEGQAARLGIVEPVKGRAVFILEREYTMLVTSGSFPIDVAAAASLYAAVRLEGQPFSLSGAAAAIGRSRHYVGTAYKVLLKALGSKLDVIDYSNYIKKHLAGLLNPLQTSAKQAVVTVSFNKLLAWSLETDEVRGGNTTSLAAAALHVAAQAHQVKLTVQVVAAVFDAQLSTVQKHVREIRAALLAGAQESNMPWLQNLNKNTVLTCLDTIMLVTSCMSEEAPQSSAQPGRADQNTVPGSADRPHALPSVAGTSTATALTEHNQQRDDEPSRKRQRQDDSHAQTASPETASTSQAQTSTGASFEVADLSSDEFAQEDVIKPHELGQYLHMERKRQHSMGSLSKQAVSGC